MAGYRDKVDRSKCLRCGFVPEDPIQIEVDHIDGKRWHNDADNLQALCANCHNLKTKVFKDNKSNLAADTLERLTYHAKDNIGLDHPPLTGDELADYHARREWTRRGPIRARRSRVIVK